MPHDLLPIVKGDQLKVKSEVVKMERSMTWARSIRRRRNNNTFMRDVRMTIEIGINNGEIGTSSFRAINTVRHYGREWIILWHVSYSVVDRRGERGLLRKARRRGGGLCVGVIRMILTNN
jgi:hypothetical protein